jgi:Lar family restriction alleviation protein
MLNSNQKLKPCPFCGCTGMLMNNKNNSMWFVCCPTGCAVSPDMDTKEEAFDWWNRRYKGTRKGEDR